MTQLEEFQHQEAIDRRDARIKELESGIKDRDARIKELESRCQDQEIRLLGLTAINTELRKQQQETIAWIQNLRTGCQDIVRQYVEAGRDMVIPGDWNQRAESRCQDLVTRFNGLDTSCRDQDEGDK